MIERARQGLLARLGLGAEHENWMLLSGIVALCGLLAVGVLVLPFFGPRVAAVTAVAVVLGIFAACYVICIPGAFRRGWGADPAGRGSHPGPP